MGDQIGLINGTIFMSFIMIGAILGFMIMRAIEKQKPRRKRRTSSRNTAKDDRTISLEKHAQRRKQNAARKSSISDPEQKKNKVIR